MLIPTRSQGPSGDGKRRDPGNEVVYIPALSALIFRAFPAFLLPYNPNTHCKLLYDENVQSYLLQSLFTTEQ